jgi:hypothetical protein
MSSSPTVVVKKGGVLTALVSGVFGTLIVCVICGAAVGLYALNMADRKFTDFLGSGKTLLEAVPQLRESLSVATDMLNDRRMPEYRQQLQTSVEVVKPERSRVPVAVIEVTNKGPETVTYLTARVVASDQSGTPFREYRTFVATPVSFNQDDWRGPLLPGSTRRYSIVLGDCPWGAGENASLEITDLRVWNQQRAATTQPALPIPAPPHP